MGFRDVICSLQDQYLSFKLDEEQILVLEKIFKFINTKGFNECTYSGAAGVGKSVITKLIVEYIEKCNIPYVLATPTNKARGVLAKCTGRDVITLHKLLTLKPTIDILELDYKDLKWDAQTLSSGIPENGILIIDECSMINSKLYEYIKKRAKLNKCKVIYAGDYKQLYAVKELDISKTFKVKEHYNLTKVHRQQADNPLMKILIELRTHPIYSFKNIYSEKGNLITFSNWRKFISTAKHLFINSVKKENPNIVKLLAYTNVRVTAFNQIIRGFLFDPDTEYAKGDILTGYDSCELKSYEKYGMPFWLYNSADYIVKSVLSKNLYIGDCAYKGYELRIKPIDELFEETLFIISKQTSKEQLNYLAKTIEYYRYAAINAKNKRDSTFRWKEYFSLMRSFATPVDLIYDGRVVRKKTLDYGYCLSVHKSQGSSYDNVLIDMGNILTCNHKESLRQLQYVAMSRTRNNISMLL